jgi:hypothetical protein
LKTIKEIYNLYEKNNKAEQDPPNVLIMKRKSVRQFPNGQRVALYYVDKINKYVTIPYEAMMWSASIPEEFKQE